MNRHIKEFKHEFVMESKGWGLYMREDDGAFRNGCWVLHHACGSDDGGWIREDPECEACESKPPKSLISLGKFLQI